MKKLLIIIVAFVFNLAANAQAPDYNDLKILFADANYEKLVKIAENYSLKEDLKKDPLPFIWLSKGLYKISLSGTADEKYKNANKEALAALGKAMKNDTDGTALEDHKEFINEFQMSIIESISNDIGMKDFSKASGWIIKYYKITKNPVGAKYLEGAAKYRKADKGGANLLWKEAEGLLGKITSVEEWSQADKELLKLGVLQTAECQIASKQTEKAKTILNKIAQWYEDDADFKAKYDELVN